MNDLLKCPLCGLDSEGLPHRPKDETGVSCRKCGDFYIDGILTCGGSPADDEGRAILSGSAKWAKILGLPPLDITAANVDKLIEGKKDISQEDKIDLILRYYSSVDPKVGHRIPFNSQFDLPVIYSPDSTEFYYLLYELAHKRHGYLDVGKTGLGGRGFLSITPKGWERLNRLDRIKLADDKLEIIAAKIDKATETKLGDAQQKASLTGMVRSSALDHQIAAIMLDAVKSKLGQRLKIDKEVVFGVEVIADIDDINFLSQRVRSFWQAISGSFLKSLTGLGINESKKAEVTRDIEDEIKLLLIDLRTGEVRKDRTQAEENKVPNNPGTPDPKRVMVVHGRNEKARKALFELLRAVDLNPIEWGEAIKETNKAAPYVGEILDEAFNKAQAIVILLTGDDMACLREEYVSPTDAPHEGIPSPQARSNVIFEAGRAFGTHPDRTVLVELEKEKTRPFSDIAGRHAVRISNRPNARKDLVDRLRTAGCAVSTDYRSDWMDAGDFDDAALSTEPLVKSPEKEERDK